LRASLLRVVLFAGFAAALLVALSGCGDGKDKDKTTIQAGPTVVVEVTPLATVAVPEGPLPTRTADFASLCQKTDQKQWDEMPPMVIDPKLAYTAVIRTEKGDVTLKLLPDIAPWAVNNFVFLSCSGFYDNLTFHQVILPPLPAGIPHPYVQAGDPMGYGLADPKLGGPGYNIPTEISDHPFLKGTVAMSNRGAGSPTGGSQFFITLEDAPELDGKFSLFAEVVAGLDVLERLTPRRAQDHGPPGDKILTITIQEGPAP
jgi:cyclophilin family peptidyl-prolyl cis-trans isomerase